VQEKLSSLATLLDAITVRVKALGLSRTAEDLRTIATELRRLGYELEAARAGGVELGATPPEPAAQR
jgi:hypothetical protein